MGGRFDEARVRELVTAYLGLRGSAGALLEEEERFSRLNGAAMEFFGDEYRPSSPMSEFSAPVDLNSGEFVAKVLGGDPDGGWGAAQRLRRQQGNLDLPLFRS